MRALHADAVVTGDGPPVRDAAVVVDDAGAIVDVGPAAEVLPRHAGPAVERIRGVLLPGLVNAHTHLELSAMRGRVPGGAGFVPWAQQMLRTRAELLPEDDGEAIERAVRELDSFGTSGVGEVTNSLAAVRPLARAGIAGCVFHEVFGVEREPLERRVAQLGEMVEERVGSWPDDLLAYAPSPHTLYTTHHEVVRLLVRRARESRVRASLHLAEHPAERRFLEGGDGPVAEWFRAMNLRLDPARQSGTGPVMLADNLGALGPHVLSVHLTDARAGELDLVARREAPVVVCPRSNLTIESKLPPLLAMRSAGIFPALGTDSLASNSSLDVLSEARALADRFPSVPAADLLRMCTWEGARALGRPDLGRIRAGARPGIFAVDGEPQGDPSAFILAHLHAPRRWVSRRNEVTS